MRSLTLIVLVCLLSAAMAFSLSAEDKMKMQRDAQLAASDPVDLGKGNCTCAGGDCMCCTNIRLGHVISFDLCANVSFDQTTQMVLVEVDINSLPIVGLEFSENTKQCFTWTIVDICLALADFHTTADAECGCISISASVIGLNFGPFNIGCFQLGGSC